jgi:hypothetical protein
VRVILGSATGTMIEWYDFYIFGSLTDEVEANEMRSRSGGNAGGFNEADLAAR